MLFDSENLVYVDKKEIYKTKLFSTNYKDIGTLHLSAALGACFLGLMLSVLMLYSYDKDNMDEVFSFSDKIKGVGQAKSYLSKLSQNLLYLKSEEPNDNTVNFFDVNYQKFDFYDYIKFNNLMYSTYVNDFFFPEILSKNKLYNDISFFISLLQSEYNYPLLTPYSSLYALESNFFKVLRNTITFNNEFIFDIIMENLNINMFHAEVTEDQCRNFFCKLFEVLENNSIIIFDLEKTKISFNKLYQDDLNIVLNRSFQPIIFGCLANDYYETKFHIDPSMYTKLYRKYQKFDTEHKHQIDDFLFFSILSSTTKMIQYQSTLNNIFLEEIIKRLNA